MSAGLPQYVSAQSSDNVEIDSSVLNELGAFRDYSRQAPAKPVLTRPAEKQEKKAERAEADEDAAVRQFPVKYRMRSESANPSMNRSRVFPLPRRKPEIPAKAGEGTPIPPTRPDIQSASRDFVRKARARVATEMREKRRDVRGNGPVMPAAPAPDVKAEPLVEDVLEFQTVGEDRPRKRKIIEPDAEKVLAAVTEIAEPPAKKPQEKPEEREVASNAPVPPPVPVSRRKAKLAPAAGRQATDITEPLVRPRARKASIPRRPPEDYSSEKDYISVPFAPSEADLNSELRNVLDSHITQMMQTNPGWRLQIQGFAGAADQDPSHARRISLSRALAVREYLLDKGIEPYRIDVRALGMQTDRTPLNRVDLVLFDPV